MKFVRIAFLFCALAWVVGAHAQGGMMPGPGTPAASGGGGGTVTAQDGSVASVKYQATSNSFSYTGLTLTGALTNPGLVCWVLRADASNNVATGLALTWGAQSMTLRSSGVAVANTAGAFLFGLRNPTSGNQTLTVTATNTASDNFVNCFSFINVNQSSDAAAFPNPTSARAATTLSVTSSANHIAVGAFENTTNFTGFLGTTVLTDNSSGSIISAGGDYVSSSGASTTVGSANSADNIAGMDISN